MTYTMPPQVTVNLQQLEAQMDTMALEDLEITAPDAPGMYDR